jgi:hypothetical protein
MGIWCENINFAKCYIFVLYYPEKPNNIVESLIPKRFPHAKIENKRLLDKICYNDNILS